MAPQPSSKSGGHAHLRCGVLCNHAPCHMQFLRSLREQLTELHSFDLGDISPKTLQGYSFRVDVLERTLLARQQEVGGEGPPLPSSHDA